MRVMYIIYIYICVCNIYVIYRCIYHIIYIHHILSYLYIYVYIIYTYLHIYIYPYVYIMYIYIYVNTSRYFSGPDVCLAYQEKKSGVLVAVSWFSFMHAPYTVMGL